MRNCQSREDCMSVLPSQTPWNPSPGGTPTAHISSPLKGPQPKYGQFTIFHNLKNRAHCNMRCILGVHREYTVWKCISQQSEKGFFLFICRKIRYKWNFMFQYFFFIKKDFTVTSIPQKQVPIHGLSYGCREWTNRPLSNKQKVAIEYTSGKYSGVKR